MCRKYSFNVHQSEMAAPRANFIVLLFFSLSPLTQCLLDCFIDNEECEIHEGNLVQTIMGISSMTECAGLCEDERYCSTFTFFEAGSHPLNEACLLFSNCPKRRTCQGCVTGSNQDSCTCSVKFDGMVLSLPITSSTFRTSWPARGTVPTMPTAASTRTTTAATISIQRCVFSSEMIKAEV